MKPTVLHTQAPGKLQHYLHYRDDFKTWTQLTNETFQVIKTENWQVQGHTSLGRELAVKVKAPWVHRARVIAWLPPDHTTGEQELFKVEIDDGSRDCLDLEPGELEAGFDNLSKLNQKFPVQLECG